MSQSYNRGLIEDYGRWKEFSAGMWAWIFHKFTGWMLIGYLFTHIAVLSTAIGAAQGETVEVFAEDLPNVEGTGLTEVDIYTATLGGLEGLFIVRLLEVGLLAVAVFHILNGLRLLMIDLGIGLEAQDKSFYASLILTGIITVASVPTFLKGWAFRWLNDTPRSRRAEPRGCSSASRQRFSSSFSLSTSFSFTSLTTRPRLRSWVREPGWRTSATS